MPTLSYKQIRNLKRHTKLCKFICETSVLDGATSEADVDGNCNFKSNRSHKQSIKCLCDLFSHAMNIYEIT